MADGLENVTFTRAHINVMGKSCRRVPGVWFIIVGDAQFVENRHKRALNAKPSV